MLNPMSASRPAESPLLQAIGITKRYGTFLANDSVDIDLYPREIHALLGENGAGKSTLVKVMYGLIQPSAGELRWMGDKVVLAGPSEARALGVGMVFQHFSLFDNLTVAENVALGLDGSETFAAMSARLAQVSHDYGLPLDPKREVWRLSVGERQRIEIVRMLMQNPKLLILDEPTAVLTPQEADQLFVVLDRLKSEGRAILYISHKLDEVKRLCDTATILRGGKKVATCNPHEETAASLARMMVGADIGEVKAASGRTATLPRLLIRDLSMEPDDPHGVHLRNISVEVKGGEILGIAGVAGNGQDELFSALSGERLSEHTDSVIIDGEAAGALSVTARRRLGAAFVPEERLGHGTAPRMRLSENALLTGHAASGMVKRGFVDKPATLATVDKTTHDLRRAQGQARPGSGQPVGRQLAKIHCRPRNPARAGRAGREPADLGRRCRRRRRHPPGAARFVGARHRGAGDQPGPRRVGRDLRPYRRHVPRPPVRADRGGSGHARKIGTADGRRQRRPADWASGGEPCSWCLKSAPNARR